MNPGMMMNRKILLFEMNEVPWRILDDFAARHPASHIAALLARSKQLDTVCEDQIELDPWTSWPTFHRGVHDERHRVRHLGQALDSADRRYPPIWELLAGQRRSVGVFGSLHSARLPASLENYAFYLPDCFADGDFAHPQALRPFQAFNLAMTRRSARNVSRGIPLRSALAFLRRYAAHGMRPRTVGAIAAALLAERASPHLKARRRSLQPLIGMDLFLPLMRSRRPDFATFYTNHVAANMHRFWAAAFPFDAGDNPMPAAWQRDYAGEIEYGMRILDDMLGSVRALADASDYLLVAASSIGQAAVRGEKTSGYSTIVDLPRFMSRLGLARNEWQEKPAMVPCFTVSVAPARAQALEARLRTLCFGRYRVQRQHREGGNPFTFDRSGDGTFHFWVYFNETDLGQLKGELDGAPLPAADLGLGFFPQEEGVACSGRHTPFGSLFVYDPRRPARQAARATVSTLQVAPAILHNFGIAAPRYMEAPDPRLLDVAAAAGGNAIEFRGGGVETPVTRVPTQSLLQA